MISNKWSGYTLLEQIISDLNDLFFYYFALLRNAITNFFHQLFAVLTNHIRILKSNRSLSCDGTSSFKFKHDSRSWHYLQECTRLDIYQAFYEERRTQFEFWRNFMHTLQREKICKCCRLISNATSHCWNRLKSRQLLPARNHILAIDSEWATVPGYLLAGCSVANVANHPPPSEKTFGLGARCRRLVAEGSEQAIPARQRYTKRVLFGCQDRVTKRRCDPKYNPSPISTRLLGHTQLFSPAAVWVHYILSNTSKIVAFHQVRWVRGGLLLTWTRRKSFCSNVAYFRAQTNIYVHTAEQPTFKRKY